MDWKDCFEKSNLFSSKKVLIRWNLLHIIFLQKAKIFFWKRQKNCLVLNVISSIKTGLKSQISNIQNKYWNDSSYTYIKMFVHEKTKVFCFEELA